MDTDNRTPRAPGRSHRNGISLTQFFRLFPNDLSAEAFVEVARWPNGPECVHCGSSRVSRVKSRKPMPFRCKDCRKHFSVKSGTVMAESKLGVHTWLLAVYLFNTGLKGVSSMKLHRDLGVTQKTAWHLAHRIREGMKVDDFLFAGPVEADETYIGGKEKNKHQHKRMKAAGGPSGKAIVAGVKDRSSNRIAARVVPDTKSGTLTRVVADHTEKGADVFTDEAKGYLPLSSMGYAHQTVSHRTGKWVDEQAHTNGVESFWAAMKRGYHGTYHQMSYEHLHRYVAEFQHRHNERPKDTIRQMGDAFSAMEGRVLPYERLIAEGVRANAA